MSQSGAPGLRGASLACCLSRRRGGREGREGSCQGLLGNTRRAEFAVYCFADNFCACISPQPSDTLSACWTGFAGSSWTIKLPL